LLFLLSRLSSSKRLLNKATVAEATNAERDASCRERPGQQGEAFRATPRFSVAPLGLWLSERHRIHGLTPRGYRSAALAGAKAKGGRFGEKTDLGGMTFLWLNGERGFSAHRCRSAPVADPAIRSPSVRPCRERIPGGNEKRIPGGDGDPFSLRRIRIPGSHDSGAAIDRDAGMGRERRAPKSPHPGPLRLD
jgi:hypothetical protein